MYSASLFSTTGGENKIPGSNTSSADFKTRATNCALLTVTIICVCILVACGVMIVREYALGKDYHPTSCAVMNVTYAKYTINCMFCASSGKDKGGNNEKGKGACVVSSFPCLHIWVKYQSPSDGRYAEGLLHPDSLQAAGAYAQCSYSVCLKHHADNKKAIDKYANEWVEKKESFQCFYNTLEADNVIVLKLHDKYDVIHSMLWPSLAICVCGVIFLRMEVVRRGGATGSCVSLKPPDSLPNSNHATNNYQTTSGTHHDRNAGYDMQDSYDRNYDRNYDRQDRNYERTHERTHHHSGTVISHNGGRDAVMLQMQNSSADAVNGQGKVTCKIVPKDGAERESREYLLAQDSHQSNSINSLENLNNANAKSENSLSKGGKGGGTGRKGKSLDKSGGGGGKNTNNADPSRQHHVIHQDDGLPVTYVSRDGNSSSPGGQETPV